MFHNRTESIHSVSYPPRARVKMSSSKNHRWGMLIFKNFRVAMANTILLQRHKKPIICDDQAAHRRNEQEYNNSVDNIIIANNKKSNTFVSITSTLSNYSSRLPSTNLGVFRSKFPAPIILSNPFLLRSSLLGWSQSGGLV